jgi:hypothetical protein
MTNEIVFAVIVGLIVVMLVVTGRRRHEPAWAIGGEIVGFLMLAFAVRWAADIGMEALWAVFVAAAGVALWAQIETLWRHLRKRG